MSNPLGRLLSGAYQGSASAALKPDLQKTRKAQLLHVEEYTPLQLGNYILSQAPVKAREELWRLLRRGVEGTRPDLQWLGESVRSSILRQLQSGTVAG